MTLKTYTDLITAFATEVGLDPAALSKTQEIVINDLAIGLNYEGSDDFGDIVYFVDLGAPAEHRKGQVYQTLLEANALWVGTGGATLGLQQDTGHVILAGRCDVEGVTPQGLAMLLDAFSDTAQFWRDYVADAVQGSAPEFAANFMLRV
jgi:hypothetical protein